MAKRPHEPPLGSDALLVDIANVRHISSTISMSEVYAITPNILFTKSSIRGTGDRPIKRKPSAICFGACLSASTG